MCGIHNATGEVTMLEAVDQDQDEVGPVELEDVETCMLCSHTGAAPSDAIEWRGVTLRYSLCRGCGLKFMSTRPTQRWYDRYYKAAFWSEVYERRDPDQLNAERRLIRKLGRRARKIGSILNRKRQLSGSTIVAEVGAAYGECLKLLRTRHGCQVIGVEPNEVARRYAADTNSVQLVPDIAALDDVAQDGSIDVIVLSHVLENTVDPIGTLTSLRSKLKPDGWVYVDTCNFWYRDAVNPYHAFIFSPATLEGMLAATGFRVLHRFHEPDPPAARWPGDQYLTMVAELGEPTRVQATFDLDEALRKQQLGIRRFKGQPRILRKARSVTARLLGRGIWYSAA